MIKRQISFFLITGICGFIIDAGGVYVLSHIFGFNPVLARLPSLATAIITTFFLNRFFTFSHVRTASSFNDFLKYVTANGFSQGINFVVYTTLVSINFFFRKFPVAAVFCGSLTAAIFSFLVFKHIVFKADEKKF